MRELFGAYEAEARMLLKRQLPLPAYSYILKTSHAFHSSMMEPALPEFRQRG
ncbi:MAG: glycine--tRNA ligase subunit alpha [Akkermansiaceae bacterium]|nr:glycine--tRNA ligase subunit alpha [Akkermansiaceae bacterium]